MKNVFIISFERKVIDLIVSRLPSTVKPIISNNPNKCLNIANQGDVVFLYDYTKRSLLKQFYDKGCITYPNQPISELCGNRIVNTSFLDDMSRGIINREYFPVADRYLVTPEKGFIYKVGNSQQGDDKYSFDDGNFIVRYNHYIKEEFIEGRSFRILVIHDTPYLIEHVNSKTWIKNRNPDEEIVHNVFDLLHTDIYNSIHRAIKDALYISRQFRRHGILSPTLGFDYVINKDRFCLLEMNDMCGLPDDMTILSKFSDVCVDYTMK